MFLVGDNIDIEELVAAAVTEAVVTADEDPIATTHHRLKHTNNKTMPHNKSSLSSSHKHPRQHTTNDRMLWKVKVAALAALVLFVELSLGGFPSQPLSISWLGIPDSMETKLVLVVGDSNSRKTETTLLQQLPRSTSQGFISNLGKRTCRVPLFYDPDEHHHHLSANHSYVRIKSHWREDKKSLVGYDDAAAVFKELKQYNEHRRKEQWELSNHRLTFVHVGKAGGSTVECSLWIGIGSQHCDQLLSTVDKDDKPATDSAIARHVNCYTHWEKGLKCFYLQGKNPFSNVEAPEMIAPTRDERGNDYLVNMRSPLFRIASWFIYEHTENHPVVYNDRDWHCGQMVLNSCFRTFEEMTTIGLAGTPPSEDTYKGVYLRVGTNLSLQECSDWAFAAVRGQIPADYHNMYNYDWYAHRMLYDIRSNQSDIYALRMEHLQQDWSKIDTMLGGDGEIPPLLVTKQNAAQNKPLRVYNYSTTSEGMTNLCQALCSEIHAYTNILQRAVNLNPDDIATSLQELREQCGPAGVRFCGL